MNTPVIEVKPVVRLCNNKIEYGPNGRFVRYCELRLGHNLPVEKGGMGTKCAVHMPTVSDVYFTAEELNKLYAVEQDRKTAGQQAV